MINDISTANFPHVRNYDRKPAKLNRIASVEEDRTCTWLMKARIDRCVRLISRWHPEEQ